jgi:hypothetical protein
MENISTNDLFAYGVYGLITGLFLNTNLMNILTIFLGYSLGKIINISDINNISDIQKNKIKYFVYGLTIGVILSQINFHCIALGIALKIVIKESNIDSLKLAINNIITQLNKYIERFLPSKTFN